MRVRRIKYPIATASFSKIREEGCVYVDKTRYVHELSQGAPYYFLARPRRFGKSLFLDTLKEYFSGNRKLFKGLAIDRLQPEEWEQYPVIRLDLSGDSYSSIESLEFKLANILSDYEEQLEIQNPPTRVNLRFENIIKATARKTGKKVVILIDEYDSPLTTAIDKPELHERFRDELRGFYSVLKLSETYIRFCMLTGVTRYGRVSVFSGLNNLEDITFDDDFAGICGITETELHEYYDEGIAIFAENLCVGKDEAYARLKNYYDGYHFTECLLDVYNPFSLNHALNKNKIRDYWCESGSPAVFIKLLMKMDYDIDKLNGSTVSEKRLSSNCAFTSDPKPLFFQTGYLTLKAYNPERQSFTLGFPNREVESGILYNVLEIYNPGEEDAPETLADLKDYLTKGKPEQFVEYLKDYFSKIPVSLKARISNYENYYQSMIYCLLSLLGLETNAEYGTAVGYIDLLVKTPEYIYVIELKLNGTATDAMRQIDEKGYCDSFANDGRRLYRIALGFSKQTQTIESWLIK